MGYATGGQRKGQPAESGFFSLVPRRSTFLLQITCESPVFIELIQASSPSHQLGETDSAAANCRDGATGERTGANLDLVDGRRI